MRLSKLLESVGYAAPAADVDIARVEEDSRKVQPGDLFIARAGTSTNGQQFISDAIAKGAAAIVSSTPVPDCPVPVAIVPDTAKAISPLANALAGNPSQSLKVIGITGTNGKTTVTYLIRHLLNKAGIKCGMIGTVEIDDGNTRTEASMTTPAAADVARLLAAMRANGCGACAIETSSHALDQHRVNGVQFAAGGFTNLTGDHLDYHGSMDRYAAAKAVLFEGLSEEAIAVVNSRDPASARMVQDSPARVVRFGFDDLCHWQASAVQYDATGCRFILKSPDGHTLVETPLIGRHNIENALLAAAIVGELFGLSVHRIASAFADAIGAPGRLQSVATGQKFAVLVDYAHTDDGLRNALQAVRPLTRGKLRVVFGCGGDRDRTKRPRMAKSAQELADVIYVTSDNPRTESPAAIIDEICTGFDALATDRLIVQPDRRSAIQQAINDAQSGDVVLLAGKGHENYQIIGTKKHHFDDVEEAAAALSAITRASV